MKSCKSHETKNIRLLVFSFSSINLTFWCFCFVLSCGLQDLKFKYVNRKAFGASFFYWIDFTMKKAVIFSITYVKTWNLFGYSFNFWNWRASLWRNVFTIFSTCQSFQSLSRYTVFPPIVSAETILFWKLKCGNYSKEETINLLVFL